MSTLHSKWLYSGLVPKFRSWAPWFYTILRWLHSGSNSFVWEGDGGQIFPVSRCGFVLLLWTSGLIPHTTPEGYGDRWTLIFNVLISVFILSTVSLWWRPAASVCVFSTSRPLNKVSVGVRRQSVPGMQHSASLWGALWDCWSRCQQDQREQQSSIWPRLHRGGRP